MVKLRVAARIIPEVDYLKNAAESPAAQIESEKRLVVIVRDPYAWQIGTLCLEIQRAYKSCYSLDLPTIKYVKDSGDDCDIDPQLYVADALLDEGKAATDAADQRVSIKVILEGGGRIREGSVAVGNRLADERYKTQLEKTAKPPVPPFPGPSSVLGKRNVARFEEQERHSPVNKRQRLAEIPVTQIEESDEDADMEENDNGQGVVSSIEEALHREYPPLVENAQASPLLDRRVNLVDNEDPKQESPELWRGFQSLPPATRDELEELQSPPQIFSTRQRSAAATKTPVTSVLPQTSPRATPGSRRPSEQRPAATSHDPLTPASMRPRNQPASGRASSVQIRRVSRSPAQTSSASARKFIQPARRDIYDFPESDIDDSQMSPRSKGARTGRNGLAAGSGGSTTLLESPNPSEQVESQPDKQIADDVVMNTLNTDSVVDSEQIGAQNSLDRESTAVTKPPVALSTDESEDENSDDSLSAEKADGESGADGRHEAEPPSNSTALSQEMPPSITEPNEHESGGNSTHPPADPPRSDVPISPASTQVAESAKNTPTAKALTPITGTRRIRKRQAKSSQRASSQSLNGTSEGAHPGLHKSPSQLDRTRNSDDMDVRAQGRRPSLDSPGEQLSQTLLESTQMSAKALQEKLGQVSPTITKASSKPSNRPKEKQVEAPEPNSTQKDPPEPRTTGRQRKRRKSLLSAADPVNENPSTPVVTIYRATEDPTPAQSLPNRSSNSGTAAKKQKSLAADTPGRLSVDRSTDLRKSPADPSFGLTKEEIEIMKSREGMTKEQYETEKKRKQKEAKLEAERQRKAKAPATKGSSGDKAMAGTSNRTSGAAATPVAASTGKSNAATSDTTKTPAKRARKSKEPGVAVAERAESTPSGEKAASSATDTPGPPPPTTGSSTSKRNPKAPTAASIAPSSNAGTKPSTDKEPASAAAANTTNAKSSTNPKSQTKASTVSRSTAKPTPAISKPGPAPAPAPAPTKAPTLTTSRSIKELAAALRASQSSSAAASHPSTPNAAALRKKIQESSDETSSSDDDSDEDEDERAQTSAAKERKWKNAGAGIDRSIRDVTPDLDSDDDEDDDDDDD